MHHRPARPRRSGVLNRAAARARRGLALRPRRAVPLLALGVLLAVLGIAAPVVSEAVTGGTPVSLDASSLGTATALRDGGVRMGVDGAEEPAGTASSVSSSASSSVAPSAGSSARSLAGGAGTTSTVPSEAPTTSPSAARSATSAAGSTSASTESGAPSSADTSSPAAHSSASDATATATGTPSSAGPSPAATTPAAATPAAALVDGAGDALLALVNDARADVGCTALTSDADLTDRAEVRSTEMARDGSLGTGTTALAAKGADARSAVAGWLADSSDRARLLDCDRSTFGAAEVTGPGGPWWTALLT